MNKNILTTFFTVIIGVGVMAWMLSDTQDTAEKPMSESEHAEHDEYTKGPQGGRLLQDGLFSLEITLFEKGVPPEFHIYAYYDGKTLDSNEISLVIKLNRLDGQVDTFNFDKQSDYLRGDGIVTEPHSFDVTVEARYQGKQYMWQYENFEGRVQIADHTAEESGIETEHAGPRAIKEILNLTGRIQVDPNRLSQVRGRFPGVIKTIHRDIGEQVHRGDVLATIQSNESLQDYEVTAPIDGTIIKRDIQPGGITGDVPLFIIADLSRVWVELDLFNKDINRVNTGQSVILETLSGESISSKIDWLSPMIAHASQSIQARVIIDNPDKRFKPGQFVRGRVTVAEHQVALAVRKSGIQSFRDFRVVFARINDTYEVRMLELGLADHDWIEVLGGLKPGTEYVTNNSYLIKADIEKSGASHDH